jgi:hypothetical protein
VDKLSIANEMACFDLKDRKFYNSLTDEERKKFSNYLMIRWGSSVNGSKEFQEYYLIATNERLNKHFFDINKHPKLQWLCATTVSPGMGIQRHNWISSKKKESNSGIRKQLAELFPNIEDDALDLMAQLNTKKDIDTYLKKLGQEIKK